MKDFLLTIAAAAIGNAVVLVIAGLYVWAVVSA